MMPVWVLVLIVVLGVPKFEVHVMPINKYDTQAECEKVLAHVAPDMREAYPGEYNFSLVCTEGVVSEKGDDQQNPKKQT